MTLVHLMAGIVILNCYLLTFKDNNYKGMNLGAIAGGLIYILGKVA